MNNLGLYAKFEISITTGCEDMKGESRKWVILGC